MNSLKKNIYENYIEGGGGGASIRFGGGGGTGLNIGGGGGTFIGGGGGIMWGGRIPGGMWGPPCGPEPGGGPAGSFLKANWRKNCLVSLFQWVQNLFSDLSTSLLGTCQQGNALL